MPRKQEPRGLMGPEAIAWVRTLVAGLLSYANTEGWRPFRSVLPGTSEVVVVRGLAESDLYCLTMGGGGGVVGVSMYPGEAGLEALRLLYTRPSGYVPDLVFRQHCVGALVGHREHVHRRFRDMLVQAGVAPTARSQWPTVVSQTPGYFPTAPTQAEIVTMARVLWLIGHVGGRLREPEFVARLGAAPSANAWLVVTVEASAAAAATPLHSGAPRFSLSWAEPAWQTAAAEPYELTTAHRRAAREIQAGAQAGWKRTPLQLYGFFHPHKRRDDQGRLYLPYTLALLRPKTGEAVAASIATKPGIDSAEGVGFILAALARAQIAPSELRVCQGEIQQMVGQLAPAIGSHVSRQESVTGAPRFFASLAGRATHEPASAAPEEFCDDEVCAENEADPGRPGPVERPRFAPRVRFSPPGQRIVMPPDMEAPGPGYVRVLTTMKYRTTERTLAMQQRGLRAGTIPSYAGADECLSGTSQAGGDEWPDVPPATPLEAAQDLMFEAWETPVKTKRAALARQALELSPDCADAYVVLAEIARAKSARVALLRDAKAAGERALRFAYSQPEPADADLVRPYFRALRDLSEALWPPLGARRKEDQRESLDVSARLLSLDPIDLMGMRYGHGYHLLLAGLPEEATRYALGHTEEACRWAAFTALALHQTQGAWHLARKAVQYLLNHNPLVIDLLIGSDTPGHGFPEYYEGGSEEEADVCYLEGIKAWSSVPGSLDWLEQTAVSIRAAASTGSSAAVGHRQGRNEACRCGSGRKYKVCCGRDA